MAKTKLQDGKINNLIRKTIIETINAVFRDPDYGLKLQDWVKKRLKKTPKHLIPFEVVKKRYL